METIEYAKTHFKTEEELMKKAAYEGLQEQISIHQEYTKKVARLCLEAQQRGEQVHSELCDFLNQWWKKHILDLDMKYKGRI